MPRCAASRDQRDGDCKVDAQITQIFSSPRANSKREARQTDRQTDRDSNTEWQTERQTQRTTVNHNNSNDKSKTIIFKVNCAIIYEIYGTTTNNKQSKRKGDRARERVRQRESSTCISI